MLLFFGLLLLAVWVLGLLVFHFGAIVYVALVAGLGLLAYHWLSRARARRRQ